MARIGIVLVDGDPTARRERQLMLRAENFDVRSYATCAAMVADPNARTSACLVVEVEMREIGGVALLQQMRDGGWHGAGILLQAPERDGGLLPLTHGPSDTALPRTIADRPLLDAIRSALKGTRAAPFHVP